MKKRKSKILGKVITSGLLIPFGDNISMFLGVIGLLISLVAISYNFRDYKKPQNQLPEQIKEVEQAIGNLRNLEQYLEKTKDEMGATQKAKEKIENEYNKAKELQKLTNQQIEAISLAVNRRTLKDILMNNFWGFLLGVASSLIASYLYGYRKRKVVH